MNYILPKMRPNSCVSYYAFDSTQSKLMTNRVTHIQNHTGDIGPSQINSCTGTAVRFDDNHLGGEIVETDVFNAINSGDISVTLLVRTNETNDPYTDQERAFFYIGGDQDVSAIEHIEIGNNANFLYVRWTASGSAPQVIRFDGDTVPTMQLYLHTWTLVNVVFNDTDQTMKVYVNGTLLHTVNSTNLMSTDPTTSLVLGGRFVDGAVSSNWLGDLDCVIIDNAPLTSEDIEEDFRRFSGHLHPSYVASKVVLKGDLDLSNVHGYDMLLNAKVTIDTDNGIRKADIECVREIGRVSLAPLVSDTPLALPNAFDPDITEQYIDINTPVEISTVRSPIGHIPRENNYAPLLKGQIDDFDPTPDGTTIKFSCRDRMGLLVDYFIPKPVLYARELDVEEEFKQGTYDHIVIDELIGDNSDLVVTGGPPRFEVDQPYESEWKLMDYEQRPEPLFTALKAIANGLGWVIAYEWNPYLRSWRMRYYEPQRLKNNTDNILKPYDILSQSSFNTTAANIRNVIRVSFSDFEAENNTIGSTRTPIAEDGATTSSELYGKDSEGNRLPGYVEYVDTASVTKYGRRYMQMNEFTTRGIGRIEEASKLAISALRELKQPDIESSLQIRCMPEIDIDDIIYMKQDLKIHTSDLRMAVKSISHDLGLKSKTSLTLKGKPGWGHRKYLQLEARAGQAPTPLSSPDSSLLDKSSRDLLPLLRGMMENSRLISETGDINVPNRNFNSRSRGKRFTPDNWSLAVWDGLPETEPSFTQEMPDVVDGTTFRYVGESVNPVFRAYNSDLNVEIPVTSGGNTYGICSDLITVPTKRFFTTSVAGISASALLARDMRINLISRRGLLGGTGYNAANMVVIQYDKNRKFLEATDITQNASVEAMDDYWQRKENRTESITPGSDFDYTSPFRILEETRFVRFLCYNNSAVYQSVVGNITINIDEAWVERTIQGDAFNLRSLGTTYTDNTWNEVNYYNGNTTTLHEGFEEVFGRDCPALRADTNRYDSSATNKNRAYCDLEGTLQVDFIARLKGAYSTGVTLLHIKVEQHYALGGSSDIIISSNINSNGDTSVEDQASTIVNVSKGDYFVAMLRVNYRSDNGTSYDSDVQAMSFERCTLKLTQIK